MKFKRKSWRNETVSFALPMLLLLASTGAAGVLFFYAEGCDLSCVQEKLSTSQIAFSQDRARRATTTNIENKLETRNKIIAVREGDDLQHALDAAQPGDTIALQAGATFRGTFILPNKTGADAFITIRASASNEQLPSPNERLDPTRYAAALPKIVSTQNGQPAIKTSAGAHHFRFIGIEFGATPDGAGNIIALGAGDEGDLKDLPHHIEIDRCYIHGDAMRGQRRGVALNGRDIQIVNSYISDIKRKGEESQAIAGWNGAGGFHIINNYLEAAAENIIFGGADPTIPNLVPSDIEIRRNHFAKPLAWRGRWTVKNLFELKNAQRVVVDGNLFENTWADAQGGTAILFTVRNQDGNAPWSAVRDVEFTNNIVRHAGDGISILGEDYTHPSRQTANVRIANNLFYDIDAKRWDGHGIGVILAGGAAQSITLAHNTMVTTSSGVSSEESATVKNLTIDDNIFNGHILKSGSAGTEALTKIDDTRSWVMQDNCIVLTDKRAYWETNYPLKNFFFDSWAQINFANASIEDYRLSASSRCRGRATDKSDVGVNFDALRRAGAFEVIAPQASGQKN